MVASLMGLMGVHTPGEFGWVIGWWWYFIYCYVQQWPRLAIGPSLYGLLMLQFGGIVSPIDSSFLRGCLFGDEMPLRCFG
jgi:hypothetical protein